MIVCIAEKPSVAQEIARILGATTKKEGYYEGNGYQVTWTFGHLCQLKSPDQYHEEWKAWKMDCLPMIPQKYDICLIPDAGIRKQFGIIKKLYHEATTIINCGDAGQEGDLIQRYVMQMAGVRCPVKRLWISSLTEDSIREGFRNLKPQSMYDNLYRAGQARACGDWLLGMNSTRLFTLKYGGYRTVLSIGRVQTPTLAMIVDRDNEIEHFIPEPYWVLMTRYRGTVFTSTKGKLKTEQEGQTLMQKIQGRSFTVTGIQEKRGSEQVPQLYDLTALQVDCNRKFGMSAETTLKVIQSLYEKKLTTYPRVDTRFLTDDMYPKCPQILDSLKDYADLTSCLKGKPLGKSRRIFDNSKVTDHHAIIPTGVNYTSITEYERKVYDLICRRFIAVFYPDCQYATTTVTGRVGEEEFRASGRTILSQGWRAVYARSQQSGNSDNEEDDEEDKKDTDKTLPHFVIGESGAHQPLLERKMTTPPKRYTEATLLQSMETAGKFVDDETLRQAMKENGIGRPSSRASIIETIIKRGFVTRQKKLLVSTETGRKLIGRIKSNVLKSPELTGRWEKKLRDIEAGRYRLEDFMTELERMLGSIIADVKSDTCLDKDRITAPSVQSSSYKTSRYKKK